MKRKHWLRRFAQVTTSAVAMAVFVPATATAQETGKLEEVDHTAATEKALFALFPDLDTSKTRERLAALRKDPKAAKLLANVTAALDIPKTKSRDIEADVLQLIKGQKGDDAELTLNAVMRDYYDHYVVGHTDQRSLNAVVVGLEQTDNTLTDAAFGPTPQSRRIRLPRRMRR